MGRDIRFPEIAEKQRHQKDDQKRLLQLAHSLEKPIQQELTAFARAKWSTKGSTGFLAVNHFRLRKETQPGQITWWVEKDMPPLDRFRCAAYRVRLQSDINGIDSLVVQTGQSEYIVDYKDLSSLHATLLKAGNDPALVIPRQMGAVLDP